VPSNKSEEAARIDKIVVLLCFNMIHPAFRNPEAVRATLGPPQCKRQIPTLLLCELAMDLAFLRARQRRFLIGCRGPFRDIFVVAATSASRPLYACSRLMRGHPGSAALCADGRNRRLALVKEIAICGARDEKPMGYRTRYFCRIQVEDFLRARAETGSDHQSEETTNMPRAAKCLCGAFSVIVSAEPMVVNVCHCRDCQRRSGVPWTSNAYFPRETVRLNGPNKIYTRTSHVGTRINHHFCPTCGVTVCWTRETGSTRFGIPVGAFNDPSFPAPSVSFWEEARYEWSPLMENVDHWDTQPPAP
jgi:hypothetical protein